MSIKDAETLLVSLEESDNGNDIIRGKSYSTMLGFDGDDYIEATGSSNNIFAGSGNDIIAVYGNGSSQYRVSGGSGIDILLVGSRMTQDLSVLLNQTGSYQYSSLEIMLKAIDSYSEYNLLKITSQDDLANYGIIIGEEGTSSALTLTGGWQAVTSTNDDLQVFEAVLDGHKMQLQTILSEDQIVHQTSTASAASMVPAEAEIHDTVHDSDSSATDQPSALSGETGQIPDEAMPETINTDLITGLVSTGDNTLDKLIGAESLRPDSDQPVEYIPQGPDVDHTDNITDSTSTTPNLSAPESGFSSNSYGEASPSELSAASGSLALLPMHISGQNVSAQHANESAESSALALLPEHISVALASVDDDSDLPDINSISLNDLIGLDSQEAKIQIPEYAIPAHDDKDDLMQMASHNIEHGVV